MFFLSASRCPSRVDALYAAYALELKGRFRRAAKRSELAFPRGQATHILRHSFASHFVMNGGNVLSLQKILGHADISMTMRYAHLAPDHLKDAVLLNPMSSSSTNHPARGLSQVA
nr:tyrosine-type recombinase/integrase [Methylomonas sp. LWB]